MTDDEMFRKLGKVLQIVQAVRDAIGRREAVNSSDSREVLQDAATEYVLRNSRRHGTGPWHMVGEEGVNVITPFLREIHDDRPLSSQKGHRVNEVEPGYHNDAMDELPKVGARVQKKVKTPEPKYPISDRLERVIKAMPPRERKKNRDSLASIQRPTSSGRYPPVKALVGVFTWTHDISFATEILGLLSTEEERAGLLSEAVEYYKLHHLYDGEDMSFFNEWIWRDLLALVYDGTISFETASKLREQANRDSSKTLTFVRPDQSRRM